MRRELGIARCGLACCLCSENDTCEGCDSGSCPDRDACEVRACSLSRGIDHCFECEAFDSCEKVRCFQLKARTLGRFARERGVGRLLDCLERNESAGVVYHRSGIVGEYDDFDDPDALMAFIESGPAE